jgi:hypothetical protein
MSYTSTLLLLLHLIYLSYLSNVYRACSFFANSELFVSIEKYGNCINVMCNLLDIEGLCSDTVSI